MRLIHIFNDEKHARMCAAFLSKESIENELDITTNTDWGSSDYGTVTCKLWIIDEDKMDAAREWLDLFLQNPDDPRFQIKKSIPETVLEPFTSDEALKQMETVAQATRKSIRKQQSMGIVTFYLLIGCILIFLITQSTSNKPEEAPPNLPWLPMFASPLEKALLFDYPATYELLDKIINSYGLDSILHPESLPAEGKHLLREVNRTPYWKGFYSKLVNYLGPKEIPITFDEPMFEKIRQGEIWRLFTPVLLHNDIFHILFNMIWLLVLGKQIEMRLGTMRYIGFIVVTGVFSNTAQYLMTGPDFIGFSGILCAMITYVWFRQKRAPWEGYQLLPVTMGFVTVFILAIVFVQIISFFIEISGMPNVLSTQIANTAHLAGAFIGIVLSYTTKK